MGSNKFVLGAALVSTLCATSIHAAFKYTSSASQTANTAIIDSCYSILNAATQSSGSSTKSLTKQCEKYLRKQISQRSFDSANFSSPPNANFTISSNIGDTSVGQITQPQFSMDDRLNSIELKALKRLIH